MKNVALTCPQCQGKLDQPVGWIGICPYCGTAIGHAADCMCETCQDARDLDLGLNALRRMKEMKRHDEAERQRLGLLSAGSSRVSTPTVIVSANGPPAVRHRSITLVQCPDCRTLVEAGKPCPNCAPPAPPKKQCHKCGKEVDPKARFCPYCGTKQKKNCISCGNEISAKDKFCGHCGTSQTEQKPTKTCPRCHLESPQSDPYCKNCGADLH